jgi:hypothetical protein
VRNENVVRYHDGVKAVGLRGGMPLRANQGIIAEKSLIKL